MTNGVGRTENIRWQEMYDIVKKLLPLTMEYDSNGVDIYFLNRESYVKAKNVTDVDYAFLETPSGYTLLAPVLEKIVHSPLTLPGKEKKLLVFVATDGKVTDEDGKDEHLKKRFFTKPKKDLHLDTEKEPLIVLYNKSLVQKVL